LRSIVTAPKLKEPFAQSLASAGDLAGRVETEQKARRVAVPEEEFQN
jgi:hypothetical protein